MNNIKRLFSCFSVLTICLLSSLGVQAKAVTPVANMIHNQQQSITTGQQAFTLSPAMTTTENEKLAGHYSHSSHYSHGSHGSHQSHYSSRF